MAVERAPSHKPCYLFIYLPKSIWKFSAFLFVWTSGFLLYVLHNFLIGWLFFIPKKNKNWCSVRGFPLICTKQGEGCVSLRDPSCCLLLFHFLSNSVSIVKIWLCAPMWCQGLEWMQRLSCESQEKPAVSSFKLNLGRVFLSIACGGGLGRFHLPGLLADFCSNPLLWWALRNPSPTKTHHRFTLALTGLVYNTWRHPKGIDWRS